MIEKQTRAMQPYTVLKAKKPSTQQIGSMLSFLSSLPKRQATAPTCSQFVKEASTAKVYRVCGTEGHECSDTCFAVKVVKFGKFDEKEPKIQELVVAKTLGTEAEAHFNKIYKVLPAVDGNSKTLVLDFEHPWAQNVSDLSTLLTTFDMTERMWKSINFQILCAFTVAQRRIPGFTHNDAHTQNILVVRNVDEDHVCSITTNKGKRLTNYSNMLIRVIDFGQALSDEVQTRDGITFWRTLQGNKMIDFHRFAVWAAFDIQVGALRQRESGRKRYPPWFTEWRRFVARWLVVQMMPDVDSGGRDKSKGAWLSANALVPTDEGTAYLQQWYSRDAPLGLSDMLDDPYFDEFAVGGRPSITRFETEAKLKGVR